MLGSEGKKALMYILLYGVRLFIVVLTSWKAFAAKGLRLFEGLDDSACCVPVSTKAFVATSSFISGRLFFHRIRPSEFEDMKLRRTVSMELDLLNAVAGGEDDHSMLRFHVGFVDITRTMTPTVCLFPMELN